MSKMSPEQIIQHIKFVKEDIKETDKDIESTRMSLSPGNINQFYLQLF